MHTKFFLIAGCLSALLAVVIGAFGAHGLEKVLDSKLLAIYETGVKYQFYHSFALIITAMLSFLLPTSKGIKIAGAFFLSGIILFSGSLYLYTLTGKTFFGMITPIGGISFIAGWTVLLINLWRQDLRSQQ